MDWRTRPKVGEKICDCGKRIIFVLTENGKRMPVDPDTGESHWDCEFADNFRRNREPENNRSAGKQGELAFDFFEDTAKPDGQPGGGGGL
jgi:hypothetical protein